jgi:hypothetical protein
MLMLPILLAAWGCSTAPSTPTPKVDIATLCPKVQAPPELMKDSKPLLDWSSDVTAYLSEALDLLKTPPAK